MCRMVDSSAQRVKIALISLQIFTDHSQAPRRGLHLNPSSPPASLPQELHPSTSFRGRNAKEQTNALMFQRNIRARLQLTTASCC